NDQEIPGNAVDDDDNGYVDDVMGWNFIYGNNDPTDDYGHGTAVAGVLGANGNNNYGYAGVDWNCRLMILKVFSSSGQAYSSQVALAIYYAADHGADVINMSMGAGSLAEAMEEALYYAAERDVLLVAAMGNRDNEEIIY